MRVLALLAIAAAALVCAAADDPLEAGFRNPPPEARLRAYWWWLNGNTTKAAITRDLEAMRDNGYGGALLIDAGGAEQRNNRQVPAGPTFASPAWRDLYRHALAEAARLKLELSLNIQSGWNLGGPTVKPEHASKLLTFSRVAVTGPREFRDRLPKPKASNGFYREVAVLAYPLRNGPAMPRRPIRQLAIKTASEEAGFSTPKTAHLLEDVPGEPGEEDAGKADVRDLSANLSPDGSLSWTVPAGEWEILRVGYTCSGALVSTASGAWQGLAIDYMDRAALDTYWREIVDPLLQDAKRRPGALRYLTTDSWELGGANWTGAFRDEFRKRRGYDLVPYLPVIAGRILDSRESSNRFLNDFRRTIGDLIVDRHYRPFAEMAARHGLGIHPESGGPHGAPVDALQVLGVGAFPQMEFWARAATHRTRDEDRFFVKQAASVAHTYGKTLVAAEGMTSIGPHWEESLGENLKPTFDQALCEGLNRLIWHTFTSSPAEMGLPGQEYFAGTHLNPNVTWWKVASGFLQYINRSQFLMQQGVSVADVVYYYGDHVPNFEQLKGSDPARILPGYDYDSADATVLATRMRVRDGRIVLPDGVSYRLLVLPDRAAISLDALRAVRRLVLAGATVTGPKPQRVIGLGESDAEARKLADELWDSGRIPSGQSGRQVLAALGLPPDFDAPLTLDYIHRRAGSAEIYFIRNTRPEPFHGEATFRVKGKAPELWHPDTARIENASAYRPTQDGRTRVALSLDPEGSVFVVFRRPGTGLPPSAIPKPPAASPELIPGPWTVEFTPGWRAPAQVVFDRLESWTVNADAGIRFYSGTAKYATRFQSPAAGAVELDLGDVREFARVRLNGRDLGILWKRPFRMPATVKAGANELEVEITNFWRNRLIGDQQLPVADRLTSTNIAKWRADSPLAPSGLLGPVTLRRGPQ